MRRVTTGCRRARRLALAAVTLVLIGCSSSDTPAASTFVVTTSTGSATSEPPATGPTTSPPATAAPNSITATDIAEIRAAFTTFFGGADSTLDEKVAVLEHGETYRATLADASQNEQFQQLTTDVREVVAGRPEQCATLGAPLGCAVVTHDLLVSGMPMAAAIESAAVRVNGAWLVGARAWCNVVELGGAACPEESSS